MLLTLTAVALLQDHLFEAASKFVVLKDLEVSCVDASRPETSFQDNVMKVCYVPVLPSSSSASSRAEPVDATTLSSMTPLGNDGNSKERTSSFLGRTNGVLSES